MPTEFMTPEDEATETTLHKHPDDKMAQHAVERDRVQSTQELWNSVVQSTPERQFLMDVEAEVSRARIKFPISDANMVSLTEETGELAKAMLDEHPVDIYSEAVQVAAMALRCALEGDPTLNVYRVKSRSDGTRAVGQRLLSKECGRYGAKHISPMALS